MNRIRITTNNFASVVGDAFSRIENVVRTKRAASAERAIHNGAFLLQQSCTNGEISRVDLLICFVISPRTHTHARTHTHKKHTERENSPRYSFFSHSFYA